MQTVKTLSLTLLIAAVALGMTACATNRPADEQLDDGVISSRVDAKLTSDPQINPFNIDVDVIDGVVTLRGEVTDPNAREEAEKLARDTRGVRRVVNNIQVDGSRTGGERVSDAWIVTKIKSKLTADPELNPLNIDVDSRQGVVILSGKVKNEAHRRHAEELAKDTEGVKEVRNELTIRD